MPQLRDHTARSHARLSPSGAHRWLFCPPSVRFVEHCYNEGLIPEGGTTPEAEEGTRAHELAEKILNETLEFGAVLSDALDPEENASEMERGANFYAEYILQYWNSLLDLDPKDAIYYVEKAVKLDHIYKGGFGTVDACIYSREAGILHLFDYKYGKGVAISAEKNPQLMLYALGMCKEVETFGKPPREIHLHIIQPRLYGTSSWSIGYEDLQAWGRFVSHIAALALDGKGMFHLGDNCKYCQAKAFCRVYAMQYDSLELQEANTLTPEEMGALLPKLDGLLRYRTELTELATRRALSGTPIPGYKLVEGITRRSYAPESQQAMLECAEANGISPEQIGEYKLHSPSTLEKALGKKRATTLFGAFVIKPEGTPTLAPESDRRRELSRVDLSDI